LVESGRQAGHDRLVDARCQGEASSVSECSSPPFFLERRHPVQAPSALADSTTLVVWQDGILSPQADEFNERFGPSSRRSSWTRTLRSARETPLGRLVVLLAGLAFVIWSLYVAALNVPNQPNPQRADPDFSGPGCTSFLRPPQRRACTRNTTSRILPSARPTPPLLSPRLGSTRQFRLVKGCPPELLWQV
jgi:hypothetical protein